MDGSFDRSQPISYNITYPYYKTTNFLQTIKPRYHVDSEAYLVY